MKYDTRCDTEVSAGRNLLFFSLFSAFLSLPHGKFAAVGHSGGDAHFGQYPAVEGIPDGEKAYEPEQIHGGLLCI